MTGKESEESSSATFLEPANFGPGNCRNARKMPVWAISKLWAMFNWNYFKRTISSGKGGGGPRKRWRKGRNRGTQKPRHKTFLLVVCSSGFWLVMFSSLNYLRAIIVLCTCRLLCLPVVAS